METTLSLAELKLKLINIEFTINKLNSQFSSIKELIDNITSNSTTSEEKLFFLDIMKRLTFHKEFNTWYDANGDWVIEQNSKTGFIYINRFRFWSLFEENFNLDYQETKALLTNLISKHFDLTDFTLPIHIRCNEDFVPKFPLLPIINDDEKEKLFIELFSKLTFNRTFNYWENYDDEPVIKDITNTKEVFFYYYRFWIEFENKFNLNFGEVTKFLSIMVERHLNLKGYTVRCN